MGSCCHGGWFPVVRGCVRVTALYKDSYIALFTTEGAVSKLIVKDRCKQSVICRDGGVVQSRGVTVGAAAPHVCVLERARNCTSALKRPPCSVVVALIPLPALFQKL